MNIDPRLNRIVVAQPYPLLFATISGAHLYGFPSPDSDFDLRGAHVLPLEKVIGLEVKEETMECSQVIEGLEMDIVSHDVRKFFTLLLKKNGYVLEQLFSPLIVQTTPEHAELKRICCPKAAPGRRRGDETHLSPAEGQRLLTASPTAPGSCLPRPSPVMEVNESASNALASNDVVNSCSTAAGQAVPEAGAPSHTGVITKHHSHHYFGFAETQWKLFLKESPRRVKPLLYVYRVLLTGIWLMRTGVVEANLVTLNETFKLPYVPELIERKTKGENTTLTESDVAFYEAEYQRLRGVLQAAHEASQLPEAPSEATRRALNDLLVRVRLGRRAAAAAAE